MRVRSLPALITSAMIACGVICGCSATKGGAPAASRQNAAAVAPRASAARPASKAPSRPSAAAPPSAPTAASGPGASGSVNQRPAAAKTPMLQLGDHGHSVATLQRRLRGLGYWVGPVNGSFGDTTQQAVYALQKVAGLTRDGVVGPKTAAALASGPVPSARTHSGHVIEVNLRKDLVMIVNNGTVSEVLNTSTGGGYTYTSRGVTSVAETPTGHFQFQRTVDGMDISPLGQMWRPRYFYSGYALHGDTDVPPYPVSHGCIRISNAAIDWVWATNQAPIGSEIYIYY